MGSVTRGRIILTALYALFTSIPLVGHLNPLVRQAAELHRRGWRVAIAANREMASHVAREAPDLPFVDLGPLGEVAAELRRREQAASLDANFVRGTLSILDGLSLAWPVMFDGLTAAIGRDRPDVMVVDLFTSAGLSVADHAGIPLVLNNPDLLAVVPVTLLPPADHLPMLFSGRSRHSVSSWQPVLGPVVRWAAAIGAQATVGRRLNALRQSRGLPPVKVDALVRGKPILVNGVFGLEYERPLPPGITMVGPMLPLATAPLPAELEAWLSDGPPVVYCNLGTMVIAPDVMLADMTKAFDSTAIRVLWILKAANADRLPSPRPSSLRVMEWGPPPHAVLAHPNVKAFVSHCGINSVHESMVAGTPIVGIPMFADQRDMAVRVADAGTGVWIDKRRITAAALREALQRVMSEASFTERIGAVQAAIREAGGVTRAADIIAAAVRA
jgi:MGT family glycosyltransferase